MGATSLNREQLEAYRIKVGYYDQFKSKKKKKKKCSDKKKKSKRNPETEFQKKYYSYLKSDKWREIRNLLFEERGKCCERCGRMKNIQVHHKTYANIFRESMDDLLILCSICHKKEHGK